MDWQTFFPLAVGSSFQIEGGFEGTGTVEANDGASLRLRLHVPGTHLSGVFEIHYRGEGANNGLSLELEGRPRVADENAGIASSVPERRRTVSASTLIYGQPLTLEVAAVGESSARLAINGHELRVRPVARPAPPSPPPPPEVAAEKTSSPAHAEGAPRFQDWSRIVAFEPKMYFKPNDVDELVGFLTAVAKGLVKVDRLRTLGSMHSCSDICVSNAIIDVSGLEKTIVFEPDTSVVTVTANWRLHDFLLELSKVGKSLPATGGTDEQTLAGLISTATAPATKQTSMYDAIEWIEYVTIDDATKTAVVKRVGEGEPAFEGVVGSLGAIGVLTKLRMRVVDERYFETIQKVVPLSELLDDLEATSKKYDFWRIDWVPDTEEGLMWAAKEISRDQAKVDGDYPKDKSVNVLEFVFRMWERVSLGAAGPLLDDTMRVVYWLMAAIYGKTKANGPMRNMLPVDRHVPLRVAMAEWSFHPNDLQRVLEHCRVHFGKHGWPNIPIEIELSKSDRWAMSAWSWPGLDYVVKFNFMYLTELCKTDAERALILGHLRGLWDSFRAADITFKAHWGKLNFLDPAFVKASYRTEVFRPLVHPMFMNDYLETRLG